MGHEKVLSSTSLERYKSLRDEYCKLQSNSHELYWIRFCNSKNKKSKWPIFDCSSFATYLYERELHLKIIIQWIHLYNSCDDDLLSVTRLEGKQLTDDLRQNQK